MNSMVKKYALGLLVFLAYYLVAENIKNKVSAFGKLTNF